MTSPFIFFLEFQRDSTSTERSRGGANQCGEARYHLQDQPREGDPRERSREEETVSILPPSLSLSTYSTWRVRVRMNENVGVDRRVPRLPFSIPDTPFYSSIDDEIFLSHKKAMADAENYEITRRAEANKLSFPSTTTPYTSIHCLLLLLFNVLLSDIKTSFFLRVQQLIFPLFLAPFLPVSHQVTLSP